MSKGKKIVTKSIAPKSFLGFIFRSKLAVFIIILNAFVFWFIKTSPHAQNYLPKLVFYPGNILKGYWWTFLTSGFIHLQWSHFLLNMLAVFVFSYVVEKHLGFWKTFFIYFGALCISMIFSSLAYVFFLHKNLVIIGASGAVMGLVSAAMLLDPFCITWEMIVPVPMMLKGWLFIYADMKGFLNGETDGIGHLTHLFGYISIAMLVYFLSKKDRKKMRSGLVINVVSLIGVLLLRNYLINHFREDNINNKKIEQKKVVATQVKK